MFGLEHGQTSNDTSLDNQSFLYSASEGLLGSALLTPDPDPAFDAHDTKIQANSFGEYDGLGLYEQYNDSGPSSIQFGDGPGTSTQSEIHVATKDDISSQPVDELDQSLEHSFQQGQDSAHPSLIPQNSSFETLIRNAKSSALSRSPNHSDVLSQPSMSSGKAQVGMMAANTLGTPDSSKPAVEPSNATRQNYRTSVTKSSDSEFRARSSIPPRLSWMEFARQGILAAYSSRLNPYALHQKEYELLRAHITRPQITIYLNIRNAILRLWHRNPLVSVTRQEAAGCARDTRHFDLSQVAYDWLLRNGYINFGCVETSINQTALPRSKPKAAKRRTIVIVGAGMSGLGCARQLEGLVAQLEDKFISLGQKPPRIIVLEGRRRIGGRVYSHPLKGQHSPSLPQGLRSTAEMGAQIVTGFEHGNPLNFIIRGQLALPYHTLRDNSILFDCDGRIVDKDKDLKVERLWNDVLERAAVFKNKFPAVRIAEGDWQSIAYGEDPKELAGESADMLATLEEADGSFPIAKGNVVSSNTSMPEHSSVGVEKLAGRQYQHAGASANLSAAQAAKELGWELMPGVKETDTLDLMTIAQSKFPTLGETMDEGIRQYQHMLGLTAQDLRLLNWHHANLEYANAVSVNELSLGGWDQDIGNEFEGAHTTIIGGYTQVPRGLFQLPTPLDVRFDCAVESINYANTPIKDGHRVTVNCTNGQSFEADDVVLTASLGVLKHGSISFNPPLPDWKTACIERMGFGLLNKVVLVYETAFWEEDRDIFGMLNDPEQNNLDQRSYAACRGRFYLFWNCIKASGRPMLIALMAGSAAHQAEETDNGTLVREVTERLTRTFAPKQVPTPSEVIVTRWKRDPFARGSYSYVGPKTQLGDYDVMARHCGPIHFAGEATCGSHPATVHGAYLSGLRAAGEVIESMLGPIQIPSKPLVPPRLKAEPVPTRSGPKRKFGYIDVWEPINKPDPFTASVAREKELGDYESLVYDVIRTKIGDRPVKPPKPTLNPFILYTKDEWQACKTELEAQLAATKGNAAAKAARNDIRIALGAKWRNASQEVKQPYLDKCKDGKEFTAEAKAAYEASVLAWDQQAAKIRADFMRENKPPEASNGSPGSGRKGRKLS